MAKKENTTNRIAEESTRDRTYNEGQYDIYKIIRELEDLKVALAQDSFSQAQVYMETSGQFNQTSDTAIKDYRESQMKQTSDEEQKIKKKDNQVARTARNVAINRGLPIIKKIGNAYFDMELLKARDVAKTARVNNIKRNVSIGVGLTQSALINPAVFVLDVVNIGMNEYFKTNELEEKLRQENEQTRFERQALGNLRINGGR